MGSGVAAHARLHTYFWGLLCGWSGAVEEGPDLHQPAQASVSSWESMLGAFPSVLGRFSSAGYLSSRASSVVAPSFAAHPRSD